MTIGLPRAGKTTWARSTGLPILEVDAVWVALGNKGEPDYSPKQAEIVSARTRTMIQSLFLSGNNQIILCSCFLTRAEREFWAGSEWVRLFKVFDTPYAVCKERSIGGEWLKDLEYKNKSFQPLTPEEFQEGEKTVQ